MGFGEAVLVCFQKYATFRGRARRSEYWWFALALTVASVLAAVVDAVVPTGFDAGLASTLLTLATFLPSLAVSVRRLHDTGRSGWWFLIAVIPLLGLILLIVWACQDSEARDNEHGPWPKHRPEALGH